MRRRILRIAFALSLCAFDAALGTEARAAIGVFPPSGVQPILVRSGDAFYGLAYSGGNACLDLFLPPEPPDKLQEAGCGAILRIAADGTTSVAHLFVAREGARPYALRAGAGGTLLGVTRAGGAFGRGTSFSFDPANERYAVLQSLSDNGPSTNPQNALAGFAAAFADGSVLIEDEPNARFSIMQSGKPGRTVLALDATSRSGPFTIGPDGRAIFVTAGTSDCDVAIVSLGLDGSIKTIAPADRTGSAACKTGVLSDLVPIRIAADGSAVANDGNRVYMYRAGRATAAYDRTAGTSPVSTNPPANAPANTNAELFSGSAVPAGDDVLVANGLGSCGAVLRIHDEVAISVSHFEGNPCLASFDVDAPALALAALEDGTIYGMLQDATSSSDDFFTIASGKPLTVKSTIVDGTQSKDLALQQSLDFERTDKNGLSVAWNGTGTLGLPDFSVAPRTIDVEMSDLDDPHVRPRRLTPLSTATVASQRIDMTMDKLVSVSVPFSLAKLPPGRYAFVTHAGAALIGRHAATVPVGNDGFSTYLFIASSGRTASAPDPELRALNAAFAHKGAVTVAGLPIACGSQSNGVRTGSEVPVSTIARLHGHLQMTGYGPLGLHVPGPGNVTTAYAPFFASDPILVTFGKLSDDCTDATAMFSSAEDVRRYLKPEGAYVRR